MELHGGHADVVRVLLARSAPLFHVNDRGDTPLHAAVAAGDLPIMKQLLDRGASACLDLGSGLIRLGIRLQTLSDCRRCRRLAVLARPHSLPRCHRAWPVDSREVC